MRFNALVLPTVPIPAPSGGAYMSKYSPYGVEEPLRDQDPDDSRYGNTSGREDGRVMYDQEEEDYGMYAPYKNEQTSSRGYEGDPDHQYFNDGYQDNYGGNAGAYPPREQGYDNGAENFRLRTVKIIVQCIRHCFHNKLNVYSV